MGLNNININQRIESEKYILFKIKKQNKIIKKEILNIIKSIKRIDKKKTQKMRVYIKNDQIDFSNSKKNKEIFKCIKFLDLPHVNLFNEYFKNILIEDKIKKNIIMYQNISYFLNYAKIPSEIKFNILKYKNTSIYDIFKVNHKMRKIRYQLLRN